MLVDGTDIPDVFPAVDSLNVVVVAGFCPVKVHLQWNSV